MRSYNPGPDVFIICITSIMQTSQKKNELRNWPAAPGTGSATSLQILQKIFGKWAFLQLRPAKTEVT
ncbi:hypothetical protein AB205_0049360 [Aquarana catesbeiana]|uniref:Uncharacterized protein n=1 Tax=Aquarana catesbeiana TaxID=8400 RepID=A0A2G9SLD3_AQUCT|nr:hypothetical protein AB205_0049360 [Aquarana catesbeiana]